MRERFGLRQAVVPTLAFLVTACATGTMVAQDRNMVVGGAVENHADVLLQNKSGTCGVYQIIPPTVHANGRRRDKVRWDVSNACSSEVTVKIVFDKADPFEPNCNKEKTIPAGKSKNIKCQLAQ